MILKIIIDDNDYTSHRLSTCWDVVTVDLNEILCDIMLEYCKNPSTRKQAKRDFANFLASKHIYI